MSCGVIIVQLCNNLVTIWSRSRGQQGTAKRSTAPVKNR